MMKKIFIIIAAVLACASMSAQNKLVVNTATESSEFYYNEQAKVSFWGQPQGEEQNGDLTVEVTEVGEDDATFTFHLSDADVFNSFYGVRITTDSEKEWTYWTNFLYVDENATIDYSASEDEYNYFVLCLAYSKGIAEFHVMGLQPNTTYYITPLASRSYFGTPKQFQTGTQELEPLEEDETVDIADEVSEDTNIDGNVIGNIFYNINPENGGYADGCIVVTKPTDEASVDMEEGTDIFGEDFKDNFTGIVFKVPAGSGTIKITAETTGNSTLKVKIGNNAPIEMELEGKLKASFPYNVSKDTYIYIYAGQTNSDGKRRASSLVNELKIYSVELKRDPIPTGIVEVQGTKDNVQDAAIYNLSGQRLITPQKGLNIIRTENGITQKVFIQ